MIDAWCMLLVVLYVHAYSGASQVGDGSLSLVERLSSLGGTMGRGLQLVQRIYCSHCFSIVIMCISLFQACSLLSALLFGVLGMVVLLCCSTVTDY